MSAYLGALHSEGEPGPPARHVAHLEGGSLLGAAGGPGVGVEQHHPLGTILHCRQSYAQVDHLVCVCGGGGVWWGR